MVYTAEPVFSPRPWGDKSLNHAFGVASEEPIGEVWLLSDMPSMATRLRSGDDEIAPSQITESFAGRLLPRFPLLVKLISATSWLSYQVHPDDEMAQTVENQPWGKSECWFFLTDSIIAAGLREPDLFGSRPTFDEKSLNILHPCRGDAICIEPGLVHAIGPNTRLIEIQQSSDLTYRLFDWGRDRELHIEKGNKAIKPYLEPHILRKCREINSDLFSVSLIKEASGTGIMVTLEERPVMRVVIDDVVENAADFMWITLGDYWKEVST